MADVSSHRLPLVPPVLSSPPDVVGLLRALRRRWVQAISVGAICAAVAGAITWYLVPAPYTARTLLYVDPVPTSIAYPHVEPRKDFLSYQRTQIALVKSRLVLSNALNKSEIAALRLVREQPNPVEWLEKTIQVDYSVGPEILRISMTGKRPDELALLVNAVRTAYLQTIVDKQRVERLAKLAHLEKILTDRQALLQRKEGELRKLAQAVGSSHSPTIALKQQITVEQLGMAQRELRQIRSELRRLEIKERDQQEKEQALADSEIPDSVIDEYLDRDPAVAIKLQEVARRRSEWEQARLNARSTLLDQYAQRLQSAEERLRTLQDEVRPRIVQQIREEAHRKLGKIAADSWDQRVFLERLEESLKEDVKRLEDQVNSLNLGSLDVELLRRDVAQIEDVALQLGAQKQALSVEVEAPSRVSVLEEAVVSGAPDKHRPRKMAGMAALGALGLCLLGFSWWEFQVRRINTVDEVEGLGIRVMGTLPAVSDREPDSVAASAELNVLLPDRLRESVDAIRTMLLHAVPLESPRAIMVTSAFEDEGQTSLASQLAASLARTGRRTLLVDGDLRKPSVHRLYNLPGAPGFGELLVFKADVADAIRPTLVNELWVLPAGNCSGPAIQALACEKVETVFDELKQIFDFIVVASCPVLLVADPLLIARHVDGVILSLTRDVSRLPQVHAASQRLAALRLRLLGAVFRGTRGDLCASQVQRAPETRIVGCAP